MPPETEPFQITTLSLPCESDAEDELMVEVREIGISVKVYEAAYANQIILSRKNAEILGDFLLKNTAVKPTNRERRLTLVSDDADTLVAEESNDEICVSIDTGDLIWLNRQQVKLLIRFLSEWVGDDGQ